MQPILKIDLTTRDIEHYDIPTSWRSDFLGGASLAVRILFDDLDDTLDPFEDARGETEGFVPDLKPRSAHITTFVAETHSQVNQNWKRSGKKVSSMQNVYESGCQFAIL